jgi:dihydropteroate synthase
MCPPDLNPKPFKKSGFRRRVFKITLPVSGPLELGIRTLVMGIVNITPDSFSKDGCLQPGHNPIRQARRMAQEGADIIDLGGESTRPGALPVTVKEELRRVIPVIEQLKTKISVPISIDTYKPAVAKAALAAGAEIVNYIKGAQPDTAMIRIVARYKAAFILMHMPGTPRSMQKLARYDNIVADISADLQKSIEICLENGLKSDKLIIDPGIGFGKTLEHNLQILNKLKEFKTLGCPVLIGTSRKSFIGKILGNEPRERLSGSLATVSAGIINGAHIVRVHDVRQTLEAVRVTDAIINEISSGTRE